MPLASLAIDLTIGMASFTTDAGRVVQTFLQGTERMSAGARAVARDIAKQSEALAGSAANALALRAAASGLSGSYDATIEAIRKVGNASAAAKGETVALFAGSETAARAYHASLDALTAKSVGEINQLNAARDAEKAKLLAKYPDRDAQVSPADKAALDKLTASRDRLLEKLNLEFAEKAALLKQEAVLAAAAEATAAKQVAAAQKVIDANNGVSASYRQEAAEILALRRAGALGKDDARKAFDGLSARQPAAKAQQAEAEAQRKAAADAIAAAQRVGQASEEAAARQVAAAQKVVDVKRGLLETYRSEIATLRELQAIGAITPEQFKAAGAATVARNSAVQQREAEARAALQSATVQEGAAQAVAQAEVAAAATRKTALNSVALSVEALASAHRKELAELQEGLKTGAVTPAKAQSRSAEIQAQQAIIEGYRKEQAANDQLTRDAVANAAKRATADKEASRKQGEAFLSNLNNLAAGINDDGTQKARSALLALQAAQFGVGKEAEAALKKLTLLDEKTGQFGKSAFGARNRLLTLQYTISDVIASAGSGISPLTILLQQGGQVFDAFGGANAQKGSGFFKNFIGTIAQLITPMRLAVGSVAGLAVAMGFAASKTETWQRSLLDLQASLSGTGRGGAFSNNQLTALIEQIALAPGITRDAATKTVAELSRISQIGGQLFGNLALIAADYARVTGTDVPTAAKALAQAFADPEKGVKSLDAALGTLSSTTLLTVQRLAQQGDLVGAQKALYAGLEQAVKGLATSGITPLQQATNDLGNSWNRLMGKFRDSDGLQQLNRGLGSLLKRIEQVVEKGPELSRALSFVPGPIGTIANAVAPFTQPAPRHRVEGKTTFLRPEEAAAGSAAPGKANEDAIKRALELGSAYQSTAGKIDVLVGKQKALREALKAATTTYGSSSEQVKKLGSSIAGIDEEIKSLRKKGAGPKDNEPEQVRQAQLAADIKALQDAFVNERETIAFHNREVSALYQAGTVSLKDFNAAKVKEIEDGTTREIDALLKVVARRKAALADPLVQANPSEEIKIKGEIAETLAQITKLAVDGERKVVLANIESGASYKQLADQVANYRAELLQLAGDEAGAARIRTALAIKQAQELAKRSAGTPDAISAKEEADHAAALRNQNDLNTARRETDLINQGLALTEERIALLQQSGSISEIEALERQGQARQKVVAGLEAQLAAMEAIAATSKDPQLILNIERTRLELDKLKASLDPLRDKFDDLFKDAGSSFFSDLAGGKGLKAALGSFGKQVSDGITASIAKEWSSKLFGKDGIFGGAGGLLADVFGGDARGGDAKGGAAAVAQAAATAAITAAQATSAASIVAANTAAEAATATAIVTAMGASTTAIVAAIGASAAAGVGANVLGSRGGFGTGAAFGNLDLGLFLHQGGIAGLDGKATRYHSGGVAGLAPDEVPAILLRGEEVLTRRDPRHRANGGSEAGGSKAGDMIVNSSVTVNVQGQVDRRTAEQIAIETARAIQRAVARRTG